eukprot:scaffold54828_cov30-Tisochrysis_lutea.AAC.8
MRHGKIDVLRVLDQRRGAEREPLAGLQFAHAYIISGHIGTIPFAEVPLQLIQAIDRSDEFVSLFRGTPHCAVDHSHGGHVCVSRRPDT